MPSDLTYPGVYLEELPSGTATIAGVSTSIGAFVGWAPRGPLNEAFHVLNFTTFTRTFGFDVRSDVAYAVRQFFLNGGSECYVVRVASGVAWATADLPGKGVTVLSLKAIDGGNSGNSISVQVDDQTTSPQSTFNLRFTYQDGDNPANNVTEQFGNLSMNSADSRYVLKAVNGVSTLVSITRPSTATVPGTTFGYSESGDLTDISTSVNGLHNQFKLSINGLSPVTVTLTSANVAGANLAAQIANLKTAVESAVTSAGAPYAGFALTAQGTTRFRMTSGAGGENSYVHVLAGDTADISGVLKLGAQNGGTEVDAAASLRPDIQPQSATLASGTFAAADLNTLPDASHHTLQISIDNLGPDPIDIGPTAAAGGDLAAKLTDVASRLTAAVRSARPTTLGYKNFSASVQGGNELVLQSGSGGKVSRMAVSAGATADLASSLHLLSATPTSPKDFTLNGGMDNPPATLGDRIAAFTPATPRQGIYALDDVDLFNILSLPAINDSSILSEAATYCRSRRAFFIVDPPQGLSVDGMEKLAQSSNLPKSPNWEYSAVYYPWLQIADPQQGGKLRSIPPSGTMAGIYARTDSTRGVWKAPAGTEAGLVGAQALDYTLTDGENGILNPHAVNCLRYFSTYGVVSWGARTLAGDNNNALADYRYVPVRRLALFLEESLYRGTQWVVFEPNSDPLWAQIRLTIGTFLHGLFRQGAFAGITPKQAYFVKCDSETTTQNDVNLGRVNILVGFAPLKPAEFVVIQIQQIAGQLAV